MDQNFTFKDIEEAMESGRARGWEEGYLAAKLGIDWPVHYNDDKDWRKIVNGYRGIARKEKIAYKEYELAAMTVLLHEAFEDYKKINKIESMTVKENI